jgi:hypothetical protein
MGNSLFKNYPNMGLSPSFFGWRKGPPFFDDYFLNSSGPFGDSIPFGFGERVKLKINWSFQSFVERKL